MPSIDVLTIPMLAIGGILLALLSRRAMNTAAKLRSDLQESSPRRFSSLPLQVDSKPVLSVAEDATLQ